MTDIQAWLDQGKALTAETTEGPWEARMEAPTMGGGVWTLRTVGKPGIKMVVYEYQFGEGNAQFITDARTRLPQALAALQAVLDLHKPGKVYGEPGDAGCPHADDYDGPDHFWDEDYGMLCESTAIYPADPFCAGCHRDQEFELQPWPCPTVRAIRDALNTKENQ